VTPAEWAACAEPSALARRAVACKGWWWMPGMLAIGVGWIGAARICEVTDGTPELWEYRGYMRGPCTSHCRGDETPWAESHSEPLPDLSDPATLGCLLALVRQAWGYPRAHVAEMFTPGAGWLAYTNHAGDRDHRFYGATEAEALVSALEAAP
jgi:hypothetical protein